MLHTEPIVEAAVASLRSGLASVIYAVNQEMNDAIEVVAPAPENILDFGGDTQAILVYPSIEVADPDGSMEDFSLAQVSADATVRIVVVCWYDSSLLEEGATFATFQRALRRFARATVEVLVEPRAFGPGTILDRVEWSYRTNPETGERDEWTGGAYLRFMVGLSEQR